MGYTNNNYKDGDIVQIKGHIHPLEGEIGVVISRDPIDKHKWRVRIRRQIFLIKRANMQHVKT